jgi:protein-tyrosine-phosphatase
MKIHFICRGNVYRSRMAEAYARSSINESSGIEVGSSGIQADLALNGAVDSAAAKTLKEDNIENFLSPIWRQTTQALIDNADLVIFMTSTVYLDAKKAYNIDNSKNLIWNIPDIDGVYPLIKQEVDKLFKEYLVK